jgi:hypothetical protein
MNSALISLLLAGLVLCALSAGCTSPTDAYFKPAVTTSPPTTEPAATTLATTATPERLETLPPEQFVDVQVTKERPDYTLHLIYNGGKGEVNIQNVLMRATLSDGTVVEQYLNNNERHPRRGDELIVQGTRGSDRVEIYITSGGRSYKVFDEPMVTHAF